MTNIEFYVTPKGDVMIHSEDGVKQLEVHDRAFIAKMLKTFTDFYPEAIKACSRIFEKFRFNAPQFEFLIVRRMIKCNFGKFDSVMDIDQFGNLNFEEVDCPLRGECSVEGIVCKPRFNSMLSERELEIMRYYYESISPEEIAELICLSIETVKTHKRNAFRRVNVHSLAEFFTYAKQHNLFKN